MIPKNLQDVSKITLREFEHINDINNYSITKIFFDINKLNELTTKIISDLPMNPAYFYFDFLEQNLQRPIDIKGYLDPAKIDEYLNLCRELKIIPFSKTLFSDQKSIDETFIGHLFKYPQQYDQVIHPLVSRGTKINSQITENLYKNNNIRGIEKNTFIKINKEIINAAANGYTPHIISFSSSDPDSFNYLKTEIWPLLSNHASPGTAFIVLQAEYEFTRLAYSLNSQAPSLKKAIYFGSEEQNTLAFLQDNSYKKDEKTEELNKKFYEFMEAITKEYHTQELINRQ